MKRSYFEHAIVIITIECMRQMTGQFLSNCVESPLVANYGVDLCCLCSCRVHRK